GRLRPRRPGVGAVPERPVAGGRAGDGGGAEAGDEGRSTVLPRRRDRRPLRRARPGARLSEPGAGGEPALRATAGRGGAAGTGPPRRWGAVTVCHSGPGFAEVP